MSFLMSKLLREVKKGLFELR